MNAEPISTSSSGDRISPASAQVNRAARFVAAALLVLLVALALLVAIAARVPSRLRAADAPSADVALVLSGDPGNLRTRAASALVLSGAVGRLLISGAGFGGDSADYLAEAARHMGVPEDRLILERRATNTYQNITFAAPLLRASGARRVLVVTSRTHARRAGLVAEEQLPWLEVRVLGVETGEPKIRAAIRELLKIARYAWLGQLSWASLISI
jgi:uncharacterized SAM-binding protein YcdF (DUF218 family)